VLKFLNSDIKKFTYVSPVPLNAPAKYINVYIPSRIIRQYYDTYSTFLNIDNLLYNYRNDIFDPNIAGISVGAMLSGSYDIREEIRLFRPKFWGLKYFYSAVPMPNMIINPNRFSNYLFEKIKNINMPYFEFNYTKNIMTWVDRQEVGSRVYVMDGLYQTKTKAILLGAGYDFFGDTYNVFIKEEQKYKYKMNWI